MNEHRTTSILQRVPVILAVTAASYGLPVQAHAMRMRPAHVMSNTVPGTAAALAARSEVRETAATRH